MSEVIFFGHRVQSDIDSSRYEGKYRAIVDALLHDERKRIVCFDRPRITTELWLRIRFRRDHRVLIRIEPHTVSPSQYRAKISGRYGTVIGGSSHDGRGCQWSTWYDLVQTDSGTVPEKTHDVGLVASRKFSFSSLESYSLRIALIESLSGSGLSVAIAGSGWNSNSFKEVMAAFLRAMPEVRLKTSAKQVRRWFKFRLPVDVDYVGYVADSQAFVRSLRIYLIIENEGTYSSEKFSTGVPIADRVIYFGNLEYNPPPGCNCFKAFNTASSFIDAIQNGLIQEMLKAEASCRPIDHPVVQEHLEKLSSPSRIRELREKLNLHGGEND